MMLKKYGKKAAGILAMLFCYSLAVFYNGRLGLGIGNTVTVELEGMGIDPAAAGKLHENESKQDQPFFFTLWNEKAKVSLFNRELQKSTIASSMAVSHDTQLLVEEMSALYEEDMEGCIIDKKTALELFGSTEVIGKELECDGERKIIRQVIEKDRQVIYIQASGAETYLNMLTIQISDNASYSQAAHAFMSRNGIDGTILEMDLLGQITGAFLWVVPLAFSIGIIGTMLKYAKKEKEEEKNHDFCWKLAAGFAAAVLVFMLMRSISIPKDMIPTKWSDFTFWTELWKQKQEALLFLVRSAKRQPQAELVGFFFRSLLCSAMAVVFYFLSFRKKIME